MSGLMYSPQENELLINDLIVKNYDIVAENFVSLEELWPGFFRGQKRKAYSLYVQTMQLAKRDGFNVKVFSIPKRIRIRKSKAVVRQPKLKEQILYIIRNEITAAIERIPAKVMALFTDMTTENSQLKEEVRKLRPFKELVETKYKHELEFRGGR